MGRTLCISEFRPQFVELAADCVLAPAGWVERPLPALVAPQAPGPEVPLGSDHGQAHRLHAEGWNPRSFDERGTISRIVKRCCPNALVKRPSLHPRPPQACKAVGCNSLKGQGVFRRLIDERTLVQKGGAKADVFLLKEILPENHHARRDGPLDPKALKKKFYASSNPDGNSSEGEGREPYDADHDQAAGPRGSPGPAAGPAVGANHHGSLHAAAEMGAEDDAGDMGDDEQETDGAGTLAYSAGPLHRCLTDNSPLPFVGVLSSPADLNRRRRHRPPAQVGRGRGR